MPIHNGEPYIRTAIESVIAQTMQDWELVAVVDGSQDNSEKVVRTFDDRRIRVFPMPPPGGFPRALNFGLAQCRAELVARFDQDDICAPNRLELQFAELSKRPNLAVLGSAATMIDGSSQMIGSLPVPTGVERVSRGLLKRNQLIHPSVMFRRSVIRDLGGYDPAASPIFEDYHLWLRVVGHCEIDNLSDELIMYRRHPNQQTRGSTLSANALKTVAKARRQAGMALGISFTKLALYDFAYRLAQVRHELVIVRRAVQRRESRTGP
jgi:glycosyltransferase involved in cell wall biosynthesis